MKTLIAGLGNLLLRDDGVGVHAVRELAKDPPRGALVVDVGTAVLDALHLFEEAERIIAIDAMKAGGRPGTIYSCGVRDVEGSSLPVSLHEFDLLSALRLLPARALPEVVILGVEPETIDYGLELSSALEAALPRLLRAARDLAESRTDHEVECHA